MAAWNGARITPGHWVLLDELLPNHTDYSRELAQGLAITSRYLDRLPNEPNERVATLYAAKAAGNATTARFSATSSPGDLVQGFHSPCACIHWRSEFVRDRVL